MKSLANKQINYRAASVDVVMKIYSRAYSPDCNARPDEPVWTGKAGLKNIKIQGVSF